MTTDRRQQVLRLYHLALAREADDRDAFLAEACAGDKDLERDVKALLALDPPEDFLESPVINPEAERPFAGSPGLLIGQQVGAYRVHSRLGSGGMGEVYRATDTTLGRQVAIKVLPTLFAHDPERRGRFEREAKALAALNHPNIAQVYGMEAMGVGASMLVMELVTGETLADVLKKGRLPLDDALRYGAQIADALAAAHAHGILHRDVKPANVMVGESGVKVLDFGLAKRSEATNDTAETALPAAEGITHPHEVLGTVAYMSPEQAEGKLVDARSDVFSLGIVLYEMLCGQPPFRGDTAVATLAATLNAEPMRPRAVRREIPVAVERIVLRCLAKKPEGRYSSAAPLHRALVSSLESRSVSLTRTRAALVTVACVMLVGAAAFGVWSYVGASRVQWVEREAVPEITRLITENQRLTALQLFQRVERYAPASRSLIPLAEGVKTTPVSIRTTPPGARIYISDYATAAGDDLSGWHFLGESPVTNYALPRFGYYRVRALKDGFATTDQTYSPMMGLTAELTLHFADDVPSGMVWVPEAAATEPGPSATLPGFWIDRFELTNRQFKNFVDAGGYTTQQYWKQPFVRNGRALPWREAVREFRDATNRPSPAGWQLGTYPEGMGDLPVGGISWYEAMAYAEFAGKSLPTVYEWFAAAAISGLIDAVSGNFGGIGPSKVGGNSGMTRFGTFDMAGNVKEWAVNPSEQGRYLLGGAWNEDAYVFSVPDTRSPFAREAAFGVRLVRRAAAPPEGTLGPVTFPNRAVSLSAPVDERLFETFLALHAYDKTELDARVERVDESSPHWLRETVTFRAAYGNERVIAHLFLPRDSRPPYQVVALLGGSTIMQLRRVEDIEYPYQFLVRSGRAVLIPAYSGTLERGPSPLRLPVNQERERAIKWSVDLGRSIDYLATRADVDVQRLALYAVSWGGAHAPRLLAVENRFKTGVLLSAGLLAAQPPETNAWNFAPRVRVPVLMLNGRDDFTFRYETRQQPLFEALGSKEKVFSRYEGGHGNLVTRPDLIGEILDWLDKHLGPIVPRA